MPKSIVVDPKEVRKASEITFGKIPVNQYRPDFAKEVKTYGVDGLKRIFHHMLIVREFETMLNLIKTQGVYEGIEYNHPGPAHLSIGQEAAAVGQSVNLNIDDCIFGSHRSHGEILAKCLSSIHQLDDDFLMKTMKEFLAGTVLKNVDTGKQNNTRELAEDFILYGTLAEIFARQTGINKGLGGSMHSFFIPFGSMPNNAIVGGSGDISVGGALYKLVNRKPGIVIANIGDASLGCGPVWEGISFAAMDQYRQLWDKDFGSPPVLFNIMNNHYGMGGQTDGETMGYDMLARVGAGVNPEMMHAERVDGYNPLAVADATARKKQVLLEGRGPALLDVVTYRISGHSPSDVSSYRTKEEMDLWQENDCVQEFRDYLIGNKAISESEADEMKAGVVAKITETLQLVTDEKISPYTDVRIIEGVMFSNQKVEKFDDREPEVLMPMAENPRVEQLTRKQRYAYDENGKPYSANRLYTYRDGIFEAMIHRFYIDPTMVAYGEENRDWGGAFACYRGLTESIPYHRLFNSPISEGAIVGTACGYAVSGGRACVELMYCDFLGRAGDEVFNQISKWQSMSAGILRMPVVLRISIGNKYGAQHSQDWSAMVNHIPGLKVYYPATPYDAKGMLNLALAGTDPVVFFESQKSYGVGEMFVKDGVPEGYYEVSEGEPVIRRTGKDLTLLTIGHVLYSGMEVVEQMEKKYGISVELIDLRSIKPLDTDMIINSVRKTGRLVVVDGSWKTNSITSEISAIVNEKVFGNLKAPVLRLNLPDAPAPASRTLESEYYITNKMIVDAVKSVVKYKTTNSLTVK